MFYEWFWCVLSASEISLYFLHYKFTNLIRLHDWWWTGFPILIFDFKLLGFALRKYVSFIQHLSSDNHHNMDISKQAALIHPFLTKLKQRNLERFSFLDNEDMEGYMKHVHEDVHVEIIIKATYVYCTTIRFFELNALFCFC